MLMRHSCLQGVRVGAVRLAQHEHLGGPASHGVGQRHKRGSWPGHRAGPPRRATLGPGRQPGRWAAHAASCTGTAKASQEQQPRHCLLLPQSPHCPDARGTTAAAAYYLPTPRCRLASAGFRSPRLRAGTCRPMFPQRLCAFRLPPARTCSQCVPEARAGPRRLGAADGGQGHAKGRVAPLPGLLQPAGPAVQHVAAAGLHVWAV